MNSDASLILEVATLADVDHWRWVLRTSTGAFLADHTVQLDQTEAEYAAFKDLDHYLNRYARWDEPESATHIIENVGEWIGHRVLGPIAARILDYGTPVTVRVVIPPSGSLLLYRPLELAYVQGKPLALQDVSLVFEITEKIPKIHWHSVDDRLRMLAAFSLPSDVSAIDIRRERYRLAQTVRRITQTYGVAIDLRVLQYGVTRDILRDSLEEDPGWNILHFSGHGVDGALVLEKLDGSKDVISAEELVQLVRPTRGYLRLVVLSACLSAAAVTEETLRWLGVVHAHTDFRERGQRETPVLPAVAYALVRELDCAVLAMRYAVGDEFAVALADKLYDSLLGKGQQLTRALQLALRHTLTSSTHGNFPALSVCTPGLFGRTAVGLRVKAPTATVSGFDVAPVSMAGFPGEPEVFVGRSASLSRAGEVMAPHSRMTGILFHGMPGAGKTACALEVAYRYRVRRFGGFAWYKAPDEGSDIADSLSELAEKWDRQLPGLNMHDVVADEDKLTAWLPQLRELMERKAILFVLDNLESLVTTDGEWRDKRWGRVISTLLEHGGLSRTVLTARRQPVGISQFRIVVEHIHALSLGETVLLVRALPNLRHLLHSHATGDDSQTRSLLLRAVSAAQGHPTLLELIDGQADNREALETHLARWTESWSGAEEKLRSFIRQGRSVFGPEDFYGALVGWTRDISVALSSSGRSLFEFLCVLEEADRQSWIVEVTWPSLWQRLQLPDNAPDLAVCLADLTQAALVKCEKVAEDMLLYKVHPVIAEVGRREASEAMHRAVNGEMSSFWVEIWRKEVHQESSGRSSNVLMASQRASAYLLRAGRWLDACEVLATLVNRPIAATTLAAAVQNLRYVVAKLEGTEDELRTTAILARGLLAAGSLDEAEVLLRRVRAKATSADDVILVIQSTLWLVAALRNSGRLQEALSMSSDLIEYGRDRSVGAWLGLAIESTHLNVRWRLQDYKSVRTRAWEMLESMADLRDDSGDADGVIPWHIREGALKLCRDSSGRLELWNDVVVFNGKLVELQRARGATAHEIAATMLLSAGPLTMLDRWSDARKVLDVCRTVFEDESSSYYLGRVFVALADLERLTGPLEQARGLYERALASSYVASDWENCAVAHINLSSLLWAEQGASEASLAHCLAAALIWFKTGSGHFENAYKDLAGHLRDFESRRSGAAISFSAICETVERTPGVRFKELFERLVPQVLSGEEALGEVLRAFDQHHPTTRPRPRSTAGGP